MTASTQETVMKYSAFFDNRAIYGDVGILEELHRYMDMQLEAPLEKFFFNMANNALLYEPPLTFFKGIRTFNVGEKKVFDIKKAMTPIVDLIRVFALKHRIFETNTGQRMKYLADLGQFSEKEYQELRHAYYYLMGMRLDSQATQIMVHKESPQNVIFLDKLTQIDRVALVEVFKVIKNFQLKIRIQFTNSLF
jgi:CBS domain-containing protein